MNIIEELKKRGSFSNITSEEKFLKLKEGDKIYAGFDPTATSLHLGNYIQIANLKRFQKHGFGIVAVLGGATGMIGDPSFKDSERKLQTVLEVEKNKALIRKQLENFDFEVFDNYDIYKNMNILDFLRNVGKHLNVSYMLNKDSVKSRIDTGLSFTEFSYQLIQAWDFRFLYDKGVRMQLGGSDQWGNITSGVEIIRKEIGDKNLAVGITAELLTTSDGKKFGKSEGNALFLDSTLTPPFSVYQYLYNSSDFDVEKYLKWISMLSLSEIEKIMEEHNQNKKQRIAQKTLAFNVVKDIHGEIKAKECEQIRIKLFSNNLNEITVQELDEIFNSIPSFVLNEERTIVEFMSSSGISSGNKKAREMILQGAISINGMAVNDGDIPFLRGKLFNGKYSIMKKGKRNFYLIKHF